MCDSPTSNMMGIEIKALWFKRVGLDRLKTMCIRIVLGTAIGVGSIGCAAAQTKPGNADEEQVARPLDTFGPVNAFAATNKGDLYDTQAELIRLLNAKIARLEDENMRLRSELSDLRKKLVNVTTSTPKDTETR